MKQADIDAGTKLVNVVTADSNETPPDTDDETVTVKSDAQLDVVKTANVTEVTQAGQQIVYTYVVTNTGNTTLTGVTAVDDAFTPGEAGDDVTITLDKTTLAPGESATGTYTYTVKQADIDAGTKLVNVVTADSNETPPDTDDETVTVTQDPDLAIDKRFVEIIEDDGSYGGGANGKLDKAGEVIVYEIEVTNNGNVTLTNVVVTDPLTNTNQDVGTLKPGESRTITTTYTLTAADIASNGTIEPDNVAPGQIDNTARADSDQTDEVRDSVSVPLVAKPVKPAKLEIDKSVKGIKDKDGDGLVDAGDVITYRIKVTNAGAQKLTGVTIDDPLLGGTIASGITLAVGQSKTITKTYVITQEDIDTNGNDWDGKIDNTATADSNQTDPVSDSASTPIDYKPKVTIEKQILVNGAWKDADSGPGATLAKDADHMVDFRVVVKNAGNVTLTGIEVIDDNGTPGYLADDFIIALPDTLAVGGKATARYTSYWQEGTQKNVATVDTDQTGSVSDAAYYTGKKGGGDGGVCKASFWAKNKAFWDGDLTNDGPNAGKPGYPAADVLKASEKFDFFDTDGDTLYFTGELLQGAHKGKLNTVGLSLDEAYKLIAAGTPSDARPMLAREVITATLNGLAGNATPDTELREAVDWLVTHGFGKGVQDEDGYGFATNTSIGTGNSKWTSIPALSTESAASLRSQLATYNDTGFDDGVRIAADGDTLFI